jgi:outer membrane protein assembly factor BamB
MGQTWWREQVRAPGDQAVSTPVNSDSRLFVGGLMLRLDSAKPAAAVLWPETGAVSKRILSNTSTPLLLGDHVYSARSSGELVCLDARTGQQVWQTNTVTDQKSGASIHLTPNGAAVFLFTDKGDLIRARLTPQGYREISRTRLLEPTYPYGDRKCAWTPPAFANRHVFARNDEALVCASLAAEP